MKKRYIPLAALLIAVSLAGCGKQEPAAVGKTNDYMNDQEQRQLQSELEKKDKDGGESSPIPTSAATKEPEAKAASAGTDAHKQSGQAAQSALDEAKSMMDAGMVEDAKEMLGDVDESSLTTAQKEELEQISQKINENTESGGADEAFTAEEACRIINEKYGIQGDPGGMVSQVDQSGKKYYPLKFQYQKENVLIEVHIYSDGTVQEISREPIAVG